MNNNRELATKIGLLEVKSELKNDINIIIAQQKALDAKLGWLVSLFAIVGVLLAIFNFVHFLH